MRCDQWREILSAQMDGEAAPGERAMAAQHLGSCDDCSRWHDMAAVITRRAKLQVAPSLPDLSDVILGTVAGRTPRRVAARMRIAPVLRVALGVLGAVQMVLGLSQVGRSAADHVYASSQHLWHESAAWNVAAGAGFVFVALRRSRPAGMLPMLTAFVATLVLLSVGDLAMSQVAVQRLVSHAFLLAGYVIIVLLGRLDVSQDAPPPGRLRPVRSQWQVCLEPVEEPPPLRLVTASCTTRSAGRWTA